MIKEKNGQYIVSDITFGRYVSSMRSKFQQNWKTTWDKELKLISLIYDSDDLTEVIVKKNKDHNYYQRAVRTQNRHLKMLKDHLGIDYKKKEKKEEELIFLQKGFYFQMDKLDINTATVHDKTIDDGWTRYKKQDVYYARLTPEKEKLMNEYNEKLEEFIVYQKQMFEQIFEKE